jgi:hypothetical protein
VPIELTPFSLLYVVDTPRQATRMELNELTDVTRLYLEEFMFAEFSQSSFTFLDDFITNMLTSTYTMGAPYVVDYSSTARFNPFTTVFPSPVQLDEALQIAFSGDFLIEYESRLTELSPGNLFLNARVGFGEPVLRVAKKSSTNGAAIAAGAVAATLLAAGFVIFKRRSEEEVIEGKDINKTPGDITITGETFAGETYDGTASVDATSMDYTYRHRDEEEGLRAHNLGIIRERGDDDSHSPAWEGGRMYEDKADKNQGVQYGFGENITAFGNVAMSDVPLDDISATDNSSLADENTSRTDTEREPESRSRISETQSFEEVALQGPSHLSASPSESAIDEDAMSDDMLQGDDEASQISESEVSQFMASNSPQQPVAANESEISSLLSYDSLDGKAPSVHEKMGLPARSFTDDASSASRPRTVAEIEALLSANVVDDDDDESQALYEATSRSWSVATDDLSVPSQQPRTVEEIESLLSAGLDEESTYSRSQSSDIVRSASRSSST